LSTSAMPAIRPVWASLAVAQTAANLVHDAQRVTPVEKVIDLLKKLGDEVTEEGKNEAMEYDKFACFCKEQASDKLYSIQNSKDKIKEMEAEIDDLKAEISDLDGSIQELSERITEIKKQVKKAQDEREKEHEDYVEEEADLSSALEAIKGAIESLKRSKKDMKGDTDVNFLQRIKPVASKLLDVVSRAPRGTASDSQLHMVLALAQEAAAGVPMSGKSHDYKFQSNDIIETLKGLQKDFNLEKKQVDEAEFDAVVTYDKKRLNLVNEDKFKSKEKSAKEDRVGTLEEQLHTTKSNNNDETDAKEADEDFMKILTDQCEDKATLWDQRSKTRAGELTALSEATSILESGVQGNYEANSKLVGLVGKKQRLSFLQLKNSGRVLAGQRLLTLLQAKATKLQSVALAGLISKVILTDDHFVKVRGLINDLIEKLEADAESEADQKSFCDKEMRKAVSARDEQTLEIETQTAKLSQKNAEKETLLNEIDQLSQEIADSHKSLNEATNLRDSERAANEKALSMSKGGKEAVESAISVLKDFYGGASFIQAPDSDRDGNTVGDLAPKTSFDDDYSGKQKASKGILGMLEVIVSDFERTVEVVGDEEESAVKAFNQFEKETKKEIEDKKDEKTSKEGDVADTEDDITQAKDDLNDANNLKSGAIEELAKLKPMCVDGEESYAQRKKKRESEVAALEDALQILDKWKS